MKIRDNFNKNKLYFISDPHWYHKNIIEYCNRPFKSIKEMNETLILNWNKTVPRDGIVFLLGDVAWTGDIKAVRELIARLNGTIYHIRGNHCYQNRWDRDVIIDIFEGRSMDVASITVQDDELEQGHMNFFMSHYPHLFWQRGSVHLHGHVHSGPTSTASEIVPEHSMRYDVGVDNNNYYPISYHDLKVILTKKQMNFKRK